MLLHKYGANAWKVHNYRVEMVSKHVEKAIEEMNERVTELNRSRKNSQVRCTPFNFWPDYTDVTNSSSLDENSLHSSKSGLNSFRASCK